ncbi:C1 family peptidase [Nocardia sp. SYP-A9097]|uniref:C1 family peptidase n=1 Tax=Nocardia sp. SYP-A9097 TaxID=2663237 RepID=UPI001E6248B0|nr:C1 family peptidase [Nocardia sp. SYP-A9097]
MANLDTAELNLELRNSRARWAARETPQSQLNDAGKKALLGVVFTPSDLALAANMPREAGAAEPEAFAPEVDWRNHNGNHVTSVKDQKHCGSCVSFCCTAVVESMASIEHSQLLDLSEADSHFNSSHGPSCGGWNANGCMEQIKQRGVVGDTALPYMNAFDNPPQTDPANGLWKPYQRPTPNRPATQVSITSHGLVTDITARKNYLSQVGPCAASFDVYDDFYSYGSGVYHHVSGTLLGGHCVEVIGYSEAEQCWIAKNSWGTGWGMSGFFKIAYGDCNFDTYSFATSQGVKLPATAGWSGWESLGGILTSKPSAVSWGPNRIDVVVRGADSATYHRWWDGANWGGWESLGGGLQGGPAICSWDAGRLDMFATGNDHQLYHKWFQGGWSGWEALGGVLSSDPAAVSWGPNRIDVFAQGMDSAMWHLWWDGGHWGGWESLGGVLDSAPAAASWSADRLDTFVKGANSQLFHKWWNGSKWSDWENLGGYVAGDPAAVSWGPNRIDVFYPGITFQMMHKWWDGSRWSGEESLGGQLSSGVAAASWTAGRLDCFVEGTNSSMFHKWFG